MDPKVIWKDYEFRIVRTEKALLIEACLRDALGGEAWVDIEEIHDRTLPETRFAVMTAALMGLTA